MSHSIKTWRSAFKRQPLVLRLAPERVARRSREASGAGQQGTRQDGHSRGLRETYPLPRCLPSMSAINEVVITTDLETAAISPAARRRRKGKRLTARSAVAERRNAMVI